MNERNYPRATFTSYHRISGCHKVYRKLLRLRTSGPRCGSNCMVSRYSHTIFIALVPTYYFVKSGQFMFKLIKNTNIIAFITNNHYITIFYFIIIIIKISIQFCIFSINIIIELENIIILNQVFFITFVADDIVVTEYSVALYSNG